MKKLTEALKYAFTNFGPLIIFYLANHFCGLKPAILVSLAFSIGEAAFKLTRKEKITAFFKFSAAVTLVFGCMDLSLKGPVFFKFEAALTNIITGGFFALSLRGGSSIIQDFAKNQLGDKPVTPDLAWYFRMLTWVWVIYFMLKAAFYAWVARHYSLERALVIRGIAGNATLYPLMAFSIFCSRSIFLTLKKFSLLPSCRAEP
jgi:intracellular septation protein A